MYRIVRGRQLISQNLAPGTKRMFKKNINEDNTFGMITSLCCAIRKSIYLLLDDNVDMDIVSRLNAWMLPIESYHCKVLVNPPDNYRSCKTGEGRLPGYPANFRSHFQINQLYLI